MGLRVQGSKFRVQGMGYGVEGSGLSFQGSGSSSKARRLKFIEKSTTEHQTLCGGCLGSRMRSSGRM